MTAEPQIQRVAAPKEWTAEIILPDSQTQQYFNEYEEINPLPNDGLPRITLEGLDILAEGLRGDFHRWRWGIGNHPLEMPLEHIRNMTIHSMKDEPHFIVSFWYGTEYPIVGYRNMTPWVPFDILDLQQTQYRIEHPDTISLRNSGDFWFHISVQVGDAYLWDEKARRKWAKNTPREDDSDEDEPEDYCEPERPKNGTLDAWMGAAE